MSASSSSSSAPIASLDSEEPPRTILLKDRTNQSIEVSVKMACISKLVAMALDNDKEATEVPLDVSGPVLKLIAAYMTYHGGVEPPIVEKPLKSKLMKEVTNPWDAEFIDEIGQEKQALYDLILAANYMDIKSLLHLGCAKVASLIKGQPLEKIKEILSTGGKSE
jgi:S-phase kinase-associated protein 1